jgi:hypothetical protein
MNHSAPHLSASAPTIGPVRNVGAAAATAGVSVRHSPYSVRVRHGANYEDVSESVRGVVSVTPTVNQADKVGFFIPDRLDAKRQTVSIRQADRLTEPQHWGAGGTRRLTSDRSFPSPSRR